MTHQAPRALVLLSLASALTVVALEASDMVGVYALVEKTVLEPTAAAPERVQIWGAFAVAVKANGSEYSEPQRGYLYFECPQGQAAKCRKQMANRRPQSDRCWFTNCNGPVCQ